jgi:hypothetical protein
VTLKGLSLIRVVNGKIVEFYSDWNLEEILRQISAVLRVEPSEEASPT